MKNKIDEFLDLFYPKLYLWQRVYIKNLFDDDGNFIYRNIVCKPRSNSGIFMRKIMDNYRKYLEDKKESE